MIPIFGSITLSLAMGLSIVAIFLLLLFTKNRIQNFFISGWRACVSVSLLCIFSTILMLNELIASNFDVNYIALHTSLETPILYKITALWAGQSGSLLFWLFVLSTYNLIVLYKSKNQIDLGLPWVFITLSGVQLFFLIIINFIENPFSPTTANFVITNGNGLNPLLQNLTMAIHPPILYLGYVGFTVPFAYGIGALVSKNRFKLDIKDTSLVPNCLVFSKYWHNIRWMVGISRTWLGWLLGLGSCRKCIIYALVNLNCIHPFNNDSRKKGNAENLEYIY